MRFPLFYASAVPRVTILGIPIDALTIGEACTRLRAMLSEDRGHHVLTPNNEMLVEAVSHEVFRDVLRKSDLNLPDSTGLLLAARWTGQRLPERVAGVDVVERLCCELGPEHPIFLLGGRAGAGAKAGDALMRKNAQLRVAGTLERSPREEDAAEIIRMVHASGAHVLFVAFGAPQQDLWIHQHLSQMPSVRLAMGVGGTFDFLSGRIARAPRWIRRIGCEWAWRLLREPWRLRRILTAVVVFPYYVFRYGRNAKARE